MIVIWSSEGSTYEEGCDVFTEDYLQWMHDNLPLPTADHLTHPSGSTQPLSGESTTSSLSDILALPKPLTAKKRKPAINAKARYITELEAMEALKQQKEEKEAKEKEKSRLQLQKERKQQRERKKMEKQEERERKKLLQKKQKTKHVQSKRHTRASSKKPCASIPELEESFSNMNVQSGDSGEESEAECLGCGLVYGR